MEKVFLNFIISKLTKIISKKFLSLYKKYKNKKSKTKISFYKKKNSA